MYGEKFTNAIEILARLKERGIDNPVIKCADHGFEGRYNDLSPHAKIALEAGLDSMPDAPCLLAEK